MVYSPALQTYINKQNPKTNLQGQATNLPLKPDTVEINKKTNKKVGKYIAIGLAAAATVAGVLFLVTKGKTCLLELNVKKAQKVAEDLQVRAEELRKEVIELFNNNGIKQGNKVAEIIEQDDGSKLMQELASDGSILRKSIFIDKVLDSIMLPAKQGKDVYHFWQDGKLKEYAKGFEKLENGSEKVAKRLFFKDGKLERYVKGFEKLEDGSEKIAKFLQIKDGKCIAYAKGFEVLEDGRVKIAKGLLFEDGKLERYMKGCEQFEDGSEKTAKCLLFEDGKLKEYAKGFEVLEDGSKKIAKSLEFEDGKPFKNMWIFIKSFFKKEQ